MRPLTLSLLILSALVLAGCQKKTEPGARSEEPYTPDYTSLDRMEATPPSEPAPDRQPPPAETAVDAPSAPEPADSESDEPLAPVGGRVYTVQKGDTLYKLARRFYNDQARWRDIWEANQTRLRDPDQLQIGMKLIIP